MAEIEAYVKRQSKLREEQERLQREEAEQAKLEAERKWKEEEPFRIAAETKRKEEEADRKLQEERERPQRIAEARQRLHNEFERLNASIEAVNAAYAEAEIPTRLLAEKFPAKENVQDATLEELQLRIHQVSQLNLTIKNEAIYGLRSEASQLEALANSELYQKSSLESDLKWQQKKVEEQRARMRQNTGRTLAKHKEVCKEEHDLKIGGITGPLGILSAVAIIVAYFTIFYGRGSLFNFVAYFFIMFFVWAAVCWLIQIFVESIFEPELQVKYENAKSEIEKDINEHDEEALERIRKPLNEIANRRESNSALALRVKTTEQELRNRL